MKKMDKKGFTLIELMIVIAVGVILILGLTRLVSPTLKFYQQNQARQRANMKMRICIESIERAMANGRVSTLLISPSPSDPTLGLSQAQFSSMDGLTTYQIGWSNTPNNTVHLQKIPPGGGTTDTVLADYVSSLQFTLDTHDPGIVHVTVMMRVPLDESGSPDSFQTLLVSNHTILMDAS
jgi:prepilin-type N-terminal cleavage/methylation domain-containing protein